jgi:hypothetical protein
VQPIFTYYIASFSTERKHLSPVMGFAITFAAFQVGVPVLRIVRSTGGGEGVSA